MVEATQLTAQVITDMAERDAATCETLVDQFTSALATVRQIDTTEQPLGSLNVQKSINEAIHCLEQLTTRLNELSIFSCNETLDEVASVNIRFLLVPALLGYLTSKKSVPIDERLHLLEQSEIYYKDYLKRLKEYSVIASSCHLPTDEEVNAINEPTENMVSCFSRDVSLEAAAGSRDRKIARYLAKKELEEKEEYIRKQMDEGIGDDEIHRKYFTCLLKKWVAIVEDELDSTSLEKKVLKNRPSGPAAAKSVHRASEETKNKPPFKPFIITKNAATKAVFGAGYPSIPVMSVDEFVDQKMTEGTWAFTAQKETTYKNSLQQWAADPGYKEREDDKYEERKESLAEKEDEDEIKKQRQWDDFKDDNKRGEGNRMNRS